LAIAASVIRPRKAYAWPVLASDALPSRLSKASKASSSVRCAMLKLLIEAPTAVTLDGSTASTQSKMSLPLVPSFDESALPPAWLNVNSSLAAVQLTPRFESPCGLAPSGAQGAASNESVVSPDTAA